MRTYDITRVSYDTPLGYAWRLTLREGDNTKAIHVYRYDSAELQGERFTQYKNDYPKDMFSLTEQEIMLKESHRLRVLSGTYD